MVKDNIKYNKLVLGTVQFGLDYGVNNTRGQISKSDAFAILRSARKHGISMLDTAHSYGSSEKVIGEYIKNDGAPFQLISKVPKLGKDEKIEDYLDDSLHNLNTTDLYAYLFHIFDSYRSNSSLLDQLKGLKEKSKIKKYGFSLYHPEELELLLENKVDFDIVQVPYSLFDQRFTDYFKILKDQGKEIHVRSIFLQGLVFKKPGNLEEKFSGIRTQLSALNDISEKSKVGISGLCINFAVLNEDIDKIVIGVDTLANLEENILDLSLTDRVADYYDELKSLRVDDEQVILPTNWK